VKDEASAVTTVESRPAPRGAVAVDIEVVPDDVDRSLGVLRGDSAREPPQILALARPAARRNDLPCANIEGRDGGLRAVPFVLPFPTRADEDDEPSRRVRSTVCPWTFRLV